MVRSDATSSIGEQQSTKRVVNASLPRSKRKRRCDNATPSCGQCARISAPCNYIERKHRGAGKKKAYVQHLEERLSLVESALQHPTSRITTSLTPPQGDHSCHSPTRDHSPLIEQSAEALIAGVEIQDDLEVDHEATAAHELQTSPRERLILKLSEFAIQTNVEYQWMQSHADRSSFQRRVFAGLPLQQQTEQLIHPVLEELQVYGALLSAESLQFLLSQQYAAGFDCATDCSRWAIVNAVFANAFMCRATNESLAQSAPIAWSYFKNSFSVFPELIIQEPNPSACEALLYMAMFMLCTADIQTASLLTAAAVRQICNLGMHRKSYHLSVEPLTADRHKQVFWMAYILDIDLMHKCGLHSAFGTSRPTLSCLVKVHMVLARSNARESSASAQLFALGRNNIEFTMPFSLAMCATASRGILSVTQSLPPLSFFHLWYVLICPGIINLTQLPNRRKGGTLCYPLSAIFALLLTVLENPATALANADVGRIGEFVQFLHRLRGEGCNVHRILAGCVEIHQIAECAVHFHEGPKSFSVHWEMRHSNALPARLESIRQRLLLIPDWLYLAQGLLSNIPSLRTQAEVLLLGIFEVEKTTGTYGLFVPELLKPHNHGFSYGP
ncbi:hypothetical protein BGZ61DRAFT_487430 [Ilyonectria robusta]|uniref:uncharacterized protein n=1 Tax=Ilyonectria robusta TaxID=1079257 RepID=UPI001E8E5762|nr:uncharacterized protein BGZ61DRAFT_487430 [Ilyonectria robusta]KAH8652882.1 hypothetical protein BGZ61DRAFT_487430 [Ilyonectria robusta]